MATRKGLETGVIASSRERIRESPKTLFAERGYQATTTAAIGRLAGTSQSQLSKHFTDKHGLLEAILEHTWEQMNAAIRLATESVSSPRQKLEILTDMVLNSSKRTAPCAHCSCWRGAGSGERGTWWFWSPAS